jgi:hypothetical protein
MVDALRRAHRIVRPEGRVIDVRPTAADSTVEIGPLVVGNVETRDAPVRHRAAAAALAQTVDDRLFGIERTIDFDFFTYGDTIEELRDYVLDEWKDAHIDPAVVGRAVQVLRATPGRRPCLREKVQLNMLRPLFFDR